MKAAVYAGTRNLYGDMLPSVKSLLANSDADTVYLLVEDDDFPYVLPSCVKTVNVSGQELFDRDGPNYKNGWTYMVLMKTALHRIFPDMERVLFLDCDTIVRKDISSLWETDMNGKCIAGARETQYTENIYINAGVMLFDLDRMRRTGKGDELISALNSKWYAFVEQDCIAEHMQGEIEEISGDYNACEYTRHGKDPYIVHFAANPFWMHHPSVAAWREREWRRG